MLQFSLREAAKILPDLLQKALAGEEVVLVNDSNQRVQLVPILVVPPQELKPKIMDFSELDAAIVSYLRQGDRIHPTSSSVLLKISSKTLGRFCQTGDEKEWRLIDRRLQVLRKAGKIRLEKISGKRPRWKVV